MEEREQPLAELGSMVHLEEIPRLQTSSKVKVDFSATDRMNVASLGTSTEQHHASAVMPHTGPGVTCISKKTSLGGSLAESSHLQPKDYGRTFSDLRKSGFLQPLMERTILASSIIRRDID